VLAFTVTQYLQNSNVIHDIVAEGCDLDVLLRVGPRSAKVQSPIGLGLLVLVLKRRVVHLVRPAVDSRQI
jgi:hypothetical protein